MMKIFAVLFLSFLILTPSFVFADSKTGKCLNEVVSEDLGGTFLKGICRECLDEGNCALRDIKEVFFNISNFILAIVGSLVFLMYVLGGMCLLISHGNPAWVQKGYGFFRISTIGLVIVLAAYAGIQTLATILSTGDLPPSTGSIMCDGTQRTEGERCALNSTCTEGECLSLCEQQNPPTSDDKTYLEISLCMDINGSQYTFYEKNDETEILNCIQNLCPGPAEVQCCRIRRDLK